MPNLFLLFAILTGVCPRTNATVKECGPSLVRFGLAKDFGPSSSVDGLSSSEIVGLVANCERVPLTERLGEEETTYLIVNDPSFGPLKILLDVPRAGILSVAPATLAERDHFWRKAQFARSDFAFSMGTVAQAGLEATGASMSSFVRAMNHLPGPMLPDRKVTSELLNLAIINDRLTLLVNGYFEQGGNFFITHVGAASPAVQRVYYNQIGIGEGQDGFVEHGWDVTTRTGKRLKIKIQDSVLRQVQTQSQLTAEDIQNAFHNARDLSTPTKNDTRPLSEIKKRPRFRFSSEYVLKSYCEVVYAKTEDGSSYVITAFRTSGENYSRFVNSLPGPRKSRR